MSPYARLDSLGAREAGPLSVRPLVLAAGNGLRFGGGKLLKDPPRRTEDYVMAWVEKSAKG